MRKRFAAGLAALSPVTVTTGTFAMGVAAPARADLYNPRQTWLRNSTAGLFLHWGMRTNPGYTDCASWEKAVTNGGWNSPTGHGNAR